MNDQGIAGLLNEKHRLRLMLMQLTRNTKEVQQILEEIAEVDKQISVNKNDRELARLINEKHRLRLMLMQLTENAEEVQQILKGIAEVDEQISVWI